MEAAAKAYAGIIFPNASVDVDPRLSDLQKTMLDATPDCIKVLSVDGKLLTMNKAGCIALGVSETSEFGMPWLPLLPEAVRSLGLAALHKAAAGHAARFPGQSESPQGTKFWDNLLTPVIARNGQVLSILCVSRDVTETTLLDRDLKQAISREKLLTREMQHRIKNLFAVVSGLILISEREAAGDNAPEAATKILREKISALSRASDAAFSDTEVDDGDPSRVDLDFLINSVLRPYGNRCCASGDAVSIHRSNVTTLALFLHELATNSVKYGALSTDGGRVQVTWATHGHELSLTWAENGGPPIAAPPSKRGFGSEMVERIAHSVGGGISRNWQDGGLVAELRLPDAVAERET